MNGNVDCRVELPDELNVIQVGDKFQLRCSGDLPVFSEIELQFELPETQAHGLKILNAESLSPSQMLLTVASYRPGEHEFNELVLVSGIERVLVSPLQLKVESVINPENPPKEPFPSKGPLSAEMPLWFWASISIPLLIIFVAVLIKAWRVHQRKNKVQRIKDRMPAGSAYQNFNKRIRDLQRGYHFLVSGEPEGEQDKKFLVQLEKAFIDYLEFQFLIPTYGRSKGPYSRELQKKHKQITDQSISLIKECLTELDRARKAQQVSGQDSRQLVNEVRRAVNSLYKDISTKRESA